MSALKKFFEVSNQNTIESLKSEIEKRNDLIAELTIIAIRHQGKIFPKTNAYLDDLIERAQKISKP